LDTFASSFPPFLRQQNTLRSSIIKANIILSVDIPTTKRPRGRPFPIGTAHFGMAGGGGVAPRAWRGAAGHHCVGVARNIRAPGPGRIRPGGRGCGRGGAGG
jgi:hypothetical protein